MTDLGSEVTMYAVAVGARGVGMWLAHKEGATEEELLVREMESIAESPMTREQIASLAATALWCYAQAEGELKEQKAVAQS